MITDNYTEWKECPDADNCELVTSFLELVDAMVSDIQHLKAETIRARYELSQKFDPEHKWITTVDILSNLDIRNQLYLQPLLAVRADKSAWESGRKAAEVV